MPRRIPPDVLAYLRQPGEDIRQPGREEGRKEHDGGGTLGPRAEGVQGCSEETDSEACRARAPGQSREEGKQAESEPNALVTSISPAL
jgi:hypothetical protein